MLQGLSVPLPSIAPAVLLLLVGSQEEREANFPKPQPHLVPTTCPWTCTVELSGAD